jgi:hypothetical protein
MIELEHAARKSFRATYTPLKIPSDGKHKVPRRPTEKRGIVASILIEEDELDHLRKDPDLNGKRKEEMRAALKIIEKIVEDNKRGIISQDSTSSSIGDVSFDLLARICERIADLREQDLKSFHNAYKTISKEL